MTPLGRSYSHLELRPNQYNNGYEAVISEGMSAETVQENPTPFPLVRPQAACARWVVGWLVERWSDR